MTDHCDLRVAVQEAVARDPSSSLSEEICWMTPEIGNSEIRWLFFNIFYKLKILASMSSSKLMANDRQAVNRYEV